MTDMNKWIKIEKIEYLNMLGGEQGIKPTVDELTAMSKRRKEANDRNTYKVLS